MWAACDSGDALELSKSDAMVVIAEMRHVLEGMHELFQLVQGGLTVTLEV